MSKMLPNSFFVPNFYVDELLYLLTSDETKVLLYAMRKIYGFQREEQDRVRNTDRISLSQFCDGTKKRNSTEHYDHGTGLSRPTVSKVLSALKQFGIIIEISPADCMHSLAPEYILQLDESKIDFDSLYIRSNSQSAAGRSRTENARAIKPLSQKESNPVNEINTPLVNGINYPPVNEINPPLLVPLTTPGKSDLLPPVNGTNTQKKHVNKSINKEREKSSAREQAPAITPVQALSLSNSAKLEQLHSIGNTALKLEKSTTPPPPTLPASAELEQTGYKDWAEAARAGTEAGTLRMQKNGALAAEAEQYIEEWVLLFGESRYMPTRPLAINALQTYGSKKCWVALRKEADRARDQRFWHLVLGTIQKLTPQELAERDERGFLLSDTPTLGAVIALSSHAEELPAFVTQLTDEEKHVDKQYKEGLWSAQECEKRYANILARWQPQPDHAAKGRALERLPRKLNRLRDLSQAS